MKTTMNADNIPAQVDNLITAASQLAGCLHTATLSAEATQAWNKLRDALTYVTAPWDLMTIENLLTQGRFRRPPAAWIKPDCRGSEYGQWQITVCDSDNIKAHYYHTLAEDRQHDFTLVLRTAQDLKNWLATI